MLRRHCKTAEAGANLPTLAGVFATYAPLSVGAAQLLSTAPTSFIDAFEEFVTDATFQAICREGHSLGFPDKARQSAHRLRRLFRQFLSNPPAKGLLNFTSKSVSVVTKLPMPTSELGEAILQNKYLPPALPASAWMEFTRPAIRRRGQSIAEPGTERGSLGQQKDGQGR